MKAYLLRLAVMLRDYFTSAKVLTAILTYVVHWLIDDPELRIHALAIGGLLLAAQAANDHGKAAALINAAAPKPAIALAAPAADGSGRVVMVPLAVSEAVPPALPR